MRTRRTAAMNQNNLRGWFPTTTTNSADEMSVPLQQPGSTPPPQKTKSLHVHLKENLSSFFCSSADVTSITCTNRAAPVPPKKTINHNRTREGQRSLPTQIKHFKSTKSQQIMPADGKSSHPLLSHGFFPFKCKLSNRFLASAHTTAKAISLIKYFIVKGRRVTCATETLSLSTRSVF